MALSPSGEAEVLAAADERQSGEVTPLDFSQPTKFTTELRRRIAGALGQVCEALSTALSTRLRTEVTVELGEVSQGTWAAARAGLAADAVAVAVEADRPEHAMLLNIEQAMMLQALECMLGGKAAQAPAERNLSELDWSLAKGMLDTLVEQLSDAWSELSGPQLRRGELDLEGDAGVAVPPGEPALSVALETRIEGCESALWLLVPWSAAEPVGQGGEGAVEAAGAGAAGLREGLSVAQVLLRAEVGSVQMPIEQMLAIEAGAVVELGERAEAGVQLFAEEVSVGRGRPGRSANRKAVRLQETDEHPVRAARYAKLGRAELERARAHAVAEAERPRTPSILRSIFVRVWAELGRTHIALGEALELVPGTVVELDQGADQPIELFANGLCFARGRLVVTGDGAWGVTVEQLM
jgi:flagellar motor switch protein FliM